MGETDESKELERIRGIIKGQERRKKNAKIFLYCILGIVSLFVLLFLYGLYLMPSKEEQVYNAQEAMRGGKYITGKDGKEIFVRKGEDGVYHEVKYEESKEKYNIRIVMDNHDGTFIFGWDDKDGVTHLTTKDPRIK
ncbi:MAG: hypothetical protein NT047_07635 [Deltaproteobacteria bacterium]|nr:hypothetical protein [Deltaproteobacteria bacterium]